MTRSLAVATVCGLAFSVAACSGRPAPVGDAFVGPLPILLVAGGLTLVYDVMRILYERYLAWRTLKRSRNQVPYVREYSIVLPVRCARTGSTPSHAAVDADGPAHSPG